MPITPTQRRSFALDSIGHVIYLMGQRYAYWQAQECINDPRPAPSAIAAINMEVRQVEKAIENRLGNFLQEADRHADLEGLLKYVEVNRKSFDTSD